MKIPFDSEDALELNAKIFETIYYGACKTSLELAQKFGHYEIFAGSPASQGILQLVNLLLIDIQLIRDITNKIEKIKQNNVIQCIQEQDLQQIVLNLLQMLKHY